MPNLRHCSGAARVLGLVALIDLCACSPLVITEDTPETVSIRYDGVVKKLSDATAAANQACAAHGKIAHLRGTEAKAALERFAHFDCVSR
jgi:hypothetical protein